MNVKGREGGADRIRDRVKEERGGEGVARPKRIGKGPGAGPETVRQKD